MALKVNNKKLIIREKLTTFLVGTEYCLYSKYSSSEFVCLYKKQKGFFKGFFPIQMTDTIYFRDSSFSASVPSKHFEEVKKLFEEFSALENIDIEMEATV